MKFTILAAIATCALSYDPQDIPEDLVEFVTKRWEWAAHPRRADRSIKVGTHAKDRGELREDLSVVEATEDRRKCRRGVMRFDAYCHQYRVGDG